ncbi:MULTISPECIES: hypothetical protein [Cyanophyceae]|uniref:hypothetical protein n=1 Tax=Cyanophyceae TaxID=3028117 RepID=UPI001681FC91|nr:hypothetical protein [Trichocoleus sp. FACHB-69]MBD1933350.1 hypothetical protein [Trichocoleus sp. FACHB-69]
MNKRSTFPNAKSPYHRMEWQFKQILRCYADNPNAFKTIGNNLLHDSTMLAVCGKLLDHESFEGLT